MDTMVWKGYPLSGQIRKLTYSHPGIHQRPDYPLFSGVRQAADNFAASLSVGGRFL
jgi:hypothetical protein